MAEQRYTKTLEDLSYDWRLQKSPEARLAMLNEHMDEVLLRHIQEQQPKENKKEEVASVVVTDEPKEQVRTQGEPAKLRVFLERSSETTTDEEGISIPVFHLRKECFTATPEVREFSRHIGNHHRVSTPQHQEATKTDSPDFKFGHLLDSADKIRDRLLFDYIFQIKQQIVDFPRARSTMFEVRHNDLDLIPMIVKTFTSKGYKCVVEAQQIHISW